MRKRQRFAFPTDAVQVNRVGAEQKKEREGMVRPPGFEPGLTADSFPGEWEAAVIDQAARQ
jgi:hypothetical protein